MNFWVDFVVGKLGRVDEFVISEEWYSNRKELNRVDVFVARWLPFLFLVVRSFERCFFFVITVIFCVCVIHAGICLMSLNYQNITEAVCEPGTTRVAASASVIFFVRALAQTRRVRY